MKKVIFPSLLEIKRPDLEITTETTHIIWFFIKGNLAFVDWITDNYPSSAIGLLDEEQARANLMYFLGRYDRDNISISEKLLEYLNISQNTIDDMLN